MRIYFASLSFSVLLAQISGRFSSPVFPTEFADGQVETALAGYDVVECSQKISLEKGCNTIGLKEFSTQYTSVDFQGNPIFTSEFLFANQENMIAFENAPFTFAPRLGGFCAWNLANMNETSIWTAETLGPPVDLTVWKAVPSSDGTPAKIYLFGGKDGASKFLAGLPDSQKRAEAQWEQFYGTHGSLAPYALSAGPFNTACYTNGAQGQGTVRDCSKDPINVPTKG